MVLNANIPKATFERVCNPLPFLWQDGVLPYLVVSLSASYLTLYLVNYPPLFQRLGEILSNRALFDSSWLSKTHTVKITILPKLLNFFRSLPVSV